LLGLGGASRWVARRNAVPAGGRPSTVEPWGLAATLSLGLLIWAAVLYGVPSLILRPKVVSDGPIYHLYFAARWWQAGQLFLVASPFGESAATYFPAGGDLWFAWLFTVFGGEGFAKVGQVPFLLFAAAAVHGLAKRSGARSGSALLASVWFATSQPLLLFSFEANVDTIFVAGYLAACYFGFQGILGHTERGPTPDCATGQTRGSFLLAGLAAGLAWGTKPTATVFVPPLLAAMLVAIFVTGRKKRSAAGLRRSTALVVATLATGGFWWIRSWLWFGNPLYPLQLRALGRVWLSGWYESAAMKQSPFYIPVEIWQAFVDIVVSVFDPRQVPLWMVALLGAWTLFRPRGDRRARARDCLVWACAALAILNIALYWFLIPYRTQQRFMLQSVGLASIPLARLFDRGNSWRVVGLAGIVINLLTPQSWPVDPTGTTNPWSLAKILPGVPQADIPLPASFKAWSQTLESPAQTSQLAVLLALGGGALVCSWLWSRFAARPLRSSGLLAVAASLVLMGAMGLGVQLSNTSALRDFPRFRDYQAAWTFLNSITPREGQGLTIAYAGTNLPYYLMGPRHQNKVLYVNIDEHRNWLLHDYHAAAKIRGDSTVPWPTPRPGWDRLHPEYDSWLANLRAAGVQVLVVARANPNDGEFNLAEPTGFPIERVWAETHPEAFQPLYGVAENEREMRIYRVNPG
jgi:hypothetical protein